jgi:hypothetical protein
MLSLNSHLRYYNSAEVKEWVELCLQSPNTPSWRSAELKHWVANDPESNVQLCNKHLTFSTLPVNVLRNTGS